VPSRSETTERVFRRRRRVALAVAGVAVLLLVWGISAIGGSGSGGDKRAAPELPRGGRIVLPRQRIVAYYGAPQDPELGVLGIGTPEQATRKLLARAREYSRPGRPVLPALELITTLAHSAPGTDRLHRERQSDAVIRRYLGAARRARALLILDVQPGRANFIDEVIALQPYLAQPDVGLALDAEWSVPEGTVPGEVIGSTDAATVNRVSYYLARLVRQHRLPQKVLLLHQFTEGMIKDDQQKVLTRSGLAIVSNVDGFGTPEVKVGVYRQLVNSAPSPGAGRLSTSRQFNGLKLFFEEDTNLMSPASVLALRPPPDVVVYE
jgi:hypothetical protein